MSLPTIEPLPDESSSLPPARRRRQRRMIFPPGTDERADFLRELSLRSVPSFDFYLFSLLCGLVLVAALLLDSAPLFILTALLAPFMAPVVGISLGTITGTVRFVIQSLGSLMIGSLIVFLSGMLAGWATDLMPSRVYQQATFHSQFTWPDLIVLGLGASLAAYLMMRLPNQRPLVASVAIAYGLYLPVGVAGFGLSSGISGLWPQGIILFFVHLVWAALIGTFVLASFGLRPLKPAGYMLGFIYTAVGLAALMFVASTSFQIPGPGLPQIQAGVASPSETLQPSATVSLTSSVTPSLTEEPFTPTPTQTNTLLPTRTVTETMTPVPTQAWARIFASEGGGALVRAEANYNAEVIQSILNETLVEVLPEVVENGGATWVHIRLASGKEGWIVGGLLRTATPGPAQ